MGTCPKFPILFTYQNLVYGRGFAAGVTTNGRAVLTQEEPGEWWVSGVNPGAITDDGTEPHEALHKFRESYIAVLFDFAADAESFDDFKAAVERFVNTADEEEEAEWRAAVEVVRRGGCDAPLPKKSADTLTRVMVVRVDGAAAIRPNVLDVSATAA